MPVLSIGLPVYNAERFVSSSLDSILAQDFSDFELIISDNASTDGTGSICQSYAERDGRIKYFRNAQNNGASFNFNRVYALSTGKYFKWISYDDICLPGFLSKCVEVLEGDPSVVLAYPRTMLIDENGQFLRKYEDNLDLQEATPHERLKHFMSFVNLANAVFGVIRSDALQKTRLLGKYFAADYILLIELALQGKFFEIQEDLFLRRDHARNSRRLPKKELADWWDTSNHGDYSLIYNKQVAEQFYAIRNSGLCWFEKALCFMQIGRWVMRKWRAKGGYHKSLLKHKLSLFGKAGKDFCR